MTMKRIEATRMQHVFLIWAALLAIGATFPFAMSGKALGALLWLGAALLVLTMGITRLQIFAKPALAVGVLFMASFFLPVEIVVARSASFGIGWSRCEVVSTKAYLENPKPLHPKSYV